MLFIYLYMLFISLDENTICMLMLLFLCSAASISSLRAVVGVPAFPLPGGDFLANLCLNLIDKRLRLWPNREKCDVTLSWSQNFWI